MTTVEPSVGPPGVATLGTRTDLGTAWRRGSPGEGCAAALWNVRDVLQTAGGPAVIFTAGGRATGSDGVRPVPARTVEGALLGQGTAGARGMGGDVTAGTDTGLVAGRYALGDLLGRGGMAQVFRADDRVLDRPVALKMLRDSTGDDTDRLRFVREATTLAQLSHRGLVMLLDAGIDEERPFIVLELVEGPSLARTLNESGPLDIGTVADIGVQLADALAYAHSRGVVHRDVKPGNVLLGPEGRVKLADFGIARLIGDNVRHTRTGEAIGTAAYLAPEQVTGEPVTGCADTYSLGLLLLEALTGEQAYPGAPTEAALARLSRPPSMPAWLPAGWQALLAEMTRLRPDERPDLAEVSERLRNGPTTHRSPALTAAHVGAVRDDAAAAEKPASRSSRTALVRLPAVAAIVVLLALLAAGALAGKTHHHDLTASHGTVAKSPPDDPRAHPATVNATRTGTTERTRTTAALPTGTTSPSRARGGHHAGGHHAAVHRAGRHHASHRAAASHPPRHSRHHPHRAGHPRPPKKPHKPGGPPKARPHGPHEPRHR
jgi:eukaryotic-like serine/threonine-protein kinase